MFVARPDINMQNVAIDRVGEKARAMADNAESIQRYMRIVADMPVYDQHAEDALNQADKILTAALLVVRISQEQIRKNRG